MPVNAVLGALDSVAKDILSGEVVGRAEESCGVASRKGFLDNGLGGASKGDREPLEGLGEAARLRKGLLEERLRLRESPGES